jgi:putative transposase
MQERFDRAAGLRPTEGLHTPKFDLPPKSLVRFKSRDAGDRILVVERRLPGSSERPERVQFLDTETHEPLFFTDWEIAELSQSGQLWIGESAITRAPTPLSLTEEDEAKAEFYKAYVDAYVAAGSPRSRSKLIPILKAVHEARQSFWEQANPGAPFSERQPGFTTVLYYADRWASLGPVFGLGALVPPRRRGNRQSVYNFGIIDRALDEGIKLALEMPRGKAEDALTFARLYVDEHAPEIADKVVFPSLRTVQRRIARLRPATRALLRHGANTTARDHQASYVAPRPVAPLEEVECDHTTLDIQVIDHETGAVFGRPDIITFRDRATGMCLGYGIGFEAPSYAAFLAGLKHALYSKDLSAFPSVVNPWPVWGRFKRLYVDNAMHFIGHSIRQAGAQLGFEVVECIPGMPWLKGAQERFFGIMNGAVVHNLPGSTLSNAVERKKHSETELIPTVTLAVFEAFLVKWLVDIYHHEEHEGLGHIRSMKGIPIAKWNAAIGKVKVPPPPHPDIFTDLAGEVRHVTVGKSGIEWDHIRYQSDMLLYLRENPEHAAHRKRTGKSPRYIAKRDPWDLGAISIINPYDDGPDIIRVEAQEAHYARGLSAYQHAAICARAKAEANKIRNIGQLIEAKKEMLAQVSKLRGTTGIKKYEKKFAKWVDSERRRAQLTRIQPVTLFDDADDTFDQLTKDTARGPAGKKSRQSKKAKAARSIPQHPGGTFMSDDELRAAQDGYSFDDEDIGEFE